VGVQSMWISDGGADWAADPQTPNELRLHAGPESLISELRKPQLHSGATDRQTRPLRRPSDLLSSMPFALTCLRAVIGWASSAFCC
jgi:hypothetical protein